MQIGNNMGLYSGKDMELNYKTQGKSNNVYKNDEKQSHRHMPQHEKMMEQSVKPNLGSNVDLNI